MKYETSKEEKDFIRTQINKFFDNIVKVDFTGTTVSPYNLRTTLIEFGFIDDEYDNNSNDYWITFRHPDLYFLGKFIMYYNAESFELTLEVADDD